MSEAASTPPLAVRLRTCSDTDIPELSTLVLDICVDANDASDFSPEGSKAFRLRASAEEMAARSRDPALNVIRYGVSIGEEPALVGMSEMHVDIETDEAIAWKILYVYVARSVHGQGIGKMLLNKCLSNAAPGGVVRLRSAPAAIPFYERFGFQICGPATEPETHGIRGSPLKMRISGGGVAVAN